MKSIGKIEILLELLYLWHNPYRVSKKFLKKRGDADIHQYGETPLETIAEICLAADIKKEDHVFELGSGRGRTAFFIRDFFGCKVTAIEQIPLFVKKAKQIDRLMSLGIEFRCEDFLKSDLSKATLIYLYGTCLPDEIIYQICKKFHSHQRIISVSYPLSDYDPEFKVIKKIDVYYPWGEAEVYINAK